MKYRMEGTTMKAPHAHARPACLLAFALLALVFAAPAARAASALPPDRLTYQGFLVDENGDSLGKDAPKNYDVVFRIFNTATGGTALWAEQQTVTVDKGYFSVLLGEGAQVSSEPRPALNALFAGSDAADRYVEITVKGVRTGGGDLVIAPRLRLLTVPYAFLATHASQLVNNNGSPVLSASGNQVTFASGNSVKINGTVTATSFSGNGSGLTTLNANNIYTGNVKDTRLSGNVPLKNAANTFSGKNTFGSTANSFTGNGSGLTSLDASKITTGTVPLARIPVLDATRIPPLKASKITEGTFDKARIPSQFVEAAETNLRIVRGVVTDIGTRTKGSGFTVSRTATGRYTVVFDKAFSDTPAVTVTADSDNEVIATVKSVVPTQFFVKLDDDGGSDYNAYFHFIAIGPR